MGSKGAPLRIFLMIRNVSLEHAPVMRDLCDSFPSVGTLLDRCRVSPHDLCDFGAIRHQYNHRFVNLSSNLQTHARIASHVARPCLVIWKRYTHPVFI